MAVQATKPAERLAGELGVDLERVDGTGKAGKVTVPDVRAAAEALADEPPADFDAAGIRLWNDVKSYLEEHELWRPVYSNLLERYVRNVQRAAKLRNEGEAKATVKGSMGQAVVNPKIKLARDAELDSHKYAEALLLTPEALRRHLRGADDDDDDGLGF